MGEVSPLGEVSEAEIGGILVQVQQFADEAAQQALQRAQAVVHAAETEANRILTEARDRAAHEMASAPPAISQGAVAALLDALDEFGATNRALVAELAQLRQALALAGAIDPTQPSDPYQVPPPPRR